MTHPNETCISEWGNVMAHWHMFSNSPGRYAGKPDKESSLSDNDMHEHK